MKNFNYKLLSGLYYNRYDEYLELYNKRIHSPEYVSLDFTIADSPAFFLETSELMKTVVEIARLDKEIAKLSALLPKIALQQYINKCLIDEIVITNNIEGVYSTRKEIGEILDDLEGKSKNRFFGLVNKYAALQSKEDYRLIPAKTFETYTMKCFFLKYGRKILRMYRMDKYFEKITSMWSAQRNV